MSGVKDLSREAPPDAPSVEFCVVGSGCGGATAARLLAEAGREVVVLEEGRDLAGAERTQRDAAMYDQLYMERGGRATRDLSITVLQGRVLGGGGVINASDVVPAPDGVLEHWARRHGLTEFAPEAFSAFQQAALEDLSAGPIPEAMINRANGLLRTGAEALGLRGEVMMHNRVNCQGLGTCLIGCPVHAKRNPRMVSLPKAMGAGAQVYTRARVVRIDHAGSETKELVVRTLDPGGYRETGEFVIRARHVIIAANAIGSAELLLRSGIGNRHVGGHLMLQPQLPVIGYFPERVAAFRGIPQAYAVTEFEREDHPEHGLWGYRIESIMGTPGIVSTLLPFTGAPAMEKMSRYDHIAASLLLAPDAPSGRVLVERGGRLRIDYVQREDHKARLREAVKSAVRIYLAAGAEEVLVPCVPPVIFRSETDLGRADELQFAPATTPMLSAHQQGTVRMAPSEAEGGADPGGQVYGTRGVYVFDSSGFPSSASSHTMTPIIAASRLLTTRLLSSL